MDKDKFFKAINKGKLLYLDEIIEDLHAYSMGMYVDHFVENGMTRWYPEEVRALIELVDESRSNTYPWANACEKHVPDFLLKDA